MLKLIKLEWKKNNVARSIRAACIMTAVLTLFVTAMAGELHDEMPMELYGKSMIDATVDIFAHISWIIFTGVMLAIYIVGAYETKTMNLMFSYPIHRKKILFSKMLAVWVFNFCGLAAGKLLMYGTLFLMKPYTRVTVVDIPLGTAEFWLKLFLGSAAMVSITFIALPIGLKFRSTKSTIVAAVIITLFTQGNIGSFSLAGSIPFYVLLFILAAVSVVAAVYDVETKDVM